ncbi:type I-MYXAN CRISPR-associated protein Cas6/Cmx6 [Thiobacillus sedimenti]|uniref:Type I-MYXAN CRISPR-associated protein Cas6/Cmx6 n=1 Tax=Thiobacillus sedimenti TaxID=3110231 RepID=A0ABZ1CI89_9PROT|nr:type I-MYXAN CRISPR-associated protein Cas6/Cmx6 [Thiobacillus sp. SCUT-2]WRS38962.1 type I-MYXAN CRISPR-associated protein Cas6/Cmx6 [Thiobacillus sp. SCUT-2]
MTWSFPEHKPEEYTPRMVDLQFDLVGTTIPAENAQLLADALLGLLPWLGEDPGTGIQHLKGAETNQGDAALNINRRTKLFIRTPKTRVADMQQVVGKTLQLGGHTLTLGGFKTREFSPFANIYAHFVDTGSATEEQFVQDVMRELDGRFQLRCGFICGKRQSLQSASGPLYGYSLMLHDVPRHKSLQLQDEGIGRNRMLGCGIFIPHKSIAPVVPDIF